MLCFFSYVPGGHKAFVNHGAKLRFIERMHFCSRLQSCLADITQFELRLANLHAFLFRLINEIPWDLMATIGGDGAWGPDGAMVLAGGKRITTPRKYSVPVAFRIVAQTDSTSIRFSYAANQIIFNWETDPDELRVDGGPADGRHKKGGARSGQRMGRH